MVDEMNTKDKLYISNTASCSIYRTVFDKYDPPVFTSNFEKGLTTLKGLTYTKDTKSVFVEFMNTFGTHFLYDVLMGSRYTYVEETTKNSYDSLAFSGMNVRAEAKYNAMVSIDVKASYVSDKQSISKYEYGITNKYVTLVGAPMPASMDMAEWLKGTLIQPMPISYMLMPIVKLLDNIVVKERLKAAPLALDPDAIKTNLIAAYNEYCANLQLDGTVQSCTTTAPAATILSGNAATVRETSTTNTDDLGGSIFALAQQNVACSDNEALSNFRYIKGTNLVKYSYKCVKSDSITNNCQIKETIPNAIKDSDPKTSLNYLDRHELDCGTGSVMRGYQLYKSGDKLIFYKYNCCFAALTECVDFKTDNTEGGEKSIIYLDRQVNITTGANNKVFGKFKMMSDTIGNLYYSGKVCTLA